ncbi:MAG: peptidoglycan-binding protein [Lachnospiraceae bacterium]|nr:peptidoglycan-binding protein [Lachnospiraceae bacterium]
MRKNSMPAGSGSRVRKRMGIVLAAAMVLGALRPGGGSVYAAEESGQVILTPPLSSAVAAQLSEDTALFWGKNDRGTRQENEYITPAPEQDYGGRTWPREDEDAAPTPDGGDKDATPTPDGGDEDATPTPDSKDKDATPTPDSGDKDATPTPGRGDKDATPTPGRGDKDATPTPGRGDKDVTPIPTPTPTELPELPGIPTPTPTPTPTGEPKVTDVPDVSPEPTEPPTPTPKYKVNIPSESNNERYQYLFGMDVREITMSTPPKGYENREAAASHMVTITVPVWKMKANGDKYSSTYKLTVNKKLSASVKAIFKEIYALDIKFPIKQLLGFAYRKVGGVGLSKSTLMSVHSFGAAIDINPGDYDNDYFLGKGNDLRDKSNPYCIPDEVIEIFEKYHWFWGGNFEICADTMHFQYLGLEMLNYQNNPPFRDLKVKSGYMKGTDVRNLQQRLCELGYKVTIDGVYGSKTASAVKQYQKDRGLPANGQVDYKTWETIINETHYMPYAF